MENLPLDNRVKKLAQYADADEASGGGMRLPLEISIKEINLPPNPVSMFPPDPSYVPPPPTMKDLGMSGKPFSDINEQPFNTTDEERGKFYEDQNKRVAAFWKNKLNN